MLNGLLVQALTIRSLRSSRSGEPARVALTARRRAALRALQAGFTLIELMIVVVLISILAVIAAPAMRVARDDRMAFDYARQIQQMATRAKSRAAGRGAAHLLIAGPSGVRGRVWLFEALDNTSAPLGPNPASSCRTVGQWAPIIGYVPTAPAAQNLTAMVEGLELNAPINVDPDIKAAFFITDPTNPLILVATPALAFCVAPNGTVYAADGATMSAAITNMQARAPFTGIAEIRITRSENGTPRGLSRNVTLAGGAAARIHSL